MKLQRLKPDARRAAIVDAAIKLSEGTHYLQVQRKQIAVALGVSPPAITYHFGTMEQIRDAVMCEAVKQENLAVIAQGLGARDAIAVRAPNELKKRALRLAVRF